MAYVKEKLDSYFHSMNSTSRRLMEDVSVLKKKTVWNSLDAEQQDELIWKTLVKKDVANIYDHLGLTKADDTDCFPVLSISPGEKLVIDDDTSNDRPFGCSWRDEHSSPFTWQTKSQLNLHMFDEQYEEKSSKNTSPVKVPPPAVPKKARSKHLSGDTIKKRAPPPPPPVATKHHSMGEINIKSTTPTKCLDRIKKTDVVSDPESPLKNSKPKMEVPSGNKKNKIPVPKRMDSLTDKKSRQPDTTDGAAKVDTKNAKQISNDAVKAQEHPKLVLAGGALVMLQDPKNLPPFESPKADRNKTPKTKPVEVKSEEVTEIALENVPKTGFDFLDNW